MTKYTFALLAAVSFFDASAARADKLDDFKEAVTKTGCESIPYGDLQRTCKDQQSYVHDWCDGSKGPTSCDVGVTGDLQTALVKEQKHNMDLKDKRKDLADKRDHASDEQEKSKLTSEIEAVDKEIEASNKVIENLASNLSRRKDLVEKTAETINKCIDYRRAVMNIFLEALDKVKGEADPAIQPYAQTLRDRYEGSKSGHEEQITARGNAINICKNEVPRM